MLKVIYLFRHPNIGYSIHKVFDILINEIKKHEVDAVSKEMPSAGSMPWNVVKNCLYTYKQRDKKSIHHISGHIHDVVLALFGCKIVLTIHDLVFIDNVKNPVKRFYKWLFWLYIPAKMADVVVCISDQTKKNVLRHIKVKDIRVVMNPLDPEIQPVEKEFNSEKPVILHIGTGWNKNLRRTIMALEGITCHLRIIGNIDEDIVNLLKERNIEYSVGVDLNNKQIIQEYINCDIVNFPSEYEGFGMPVIEGQRTGRVVIASYIEPIIEVSGKAVAFVEPMDIESIKQGYSKVINNKEYREELIKAGLNNSLRFDVKSLAKSYIDIYEGLYH